MLGNPVLRGRLDGTISGDVVLIDDRLRADLRLTLEALNRADAPLTPSMDQQPCPAS